METNIEPGTTVRVRGFQGVACTYVGPQTRPGDYVTICGDCNGLGSIERGRTCEYCDGTGEQYDEEPCDVATGKAVVVMVGDDTRHAVDFEDMSPIEREEYCGGCGQIGCSHDGYEVTGEGGAHDVYPRSTDAQDGAP